MISMRNKFRQYTYTRIHRQQVLIKSAVDVATKKESILARVDFRNSLSAVHVGNPLAITPRKPQILFFKWKYMRCFKKSPVT